jgi:SAM-dependent methyltransferase
MRERLSSFARTFFYHFPYSARDAVARWRQMSERMEGYGLFNPRVLEVGCGSLYPYILLFRSAGVDAVGIDLLPLNVKALSLKRLRRRLRTAEHGQMFRLARRAVKDALFWWKFYRVMEKAAGMRLQHEDVCLLQMDAERLSFLDASFDFVYSSACFEHLADVPKAVQEIKRVLRPGGFAEIEIHLFASMTGGHEPELYSHHPPPVGFHVWDHVINPNWQAPLFLNRWRERQYREVFAQEFVVRGRRVTSEYGEPYLTPEVWSQLAATYTRDELKTEAVLYQLEKARTP